MVELDESTRPYALLGGCPTLDARATRALSLSRSDGGQDEVAVVGTESAGRPNADVGDGLLSRAIARPEIDPTGLGSDAKGGKGYC